MNVLTRFVSMCALWMISGCGSSPPHGATQAQAAEERASTSVDAVPQNSAPASDDAIPLGPLPRDVRPIRYALDLTIDPSADRYRGEVRIDVRLEHARRVLFVHAQELEIASAEITPAGGAPISATFRVEAEPGVAALRTDQEIPAGDAVLRIVFSAAFATGGEALFRTEIEGETYAFTQLEPISARRAFPCFDDPGFKTPFELAITAPATQEVFANTHEIERESRENGARRVRFAVTEPLPTYLVAFGVGPMDIVDAPAIAPNVVRDRALPFRGIAPKGHGPALAYALAHAPATLAALETWFGIAYPYDKLDLIAIRDFPGAMENAGAITFDERLLAVDEDASEADLRDHANVVAHELAHQWFGNLVTMAWWDDLWLNEGFATWMASRTVDAIDPSLGGEASRIDEQREAFGADALTTARRIRQSIRDHHDIQSAFDAITYSKGSSVIAMIERFVGAEAFREGIREHLARHRFGSATSDDLFSALSAASGQDLGGLRDFVDQAGVPLVRGELVCDQDATRLRVSQARHLPVGSNGDPNATRWSIPICVRYGTGTTAARRCFVLRDETATFDLEREGEACASWVHMNADGAGYYRWSMPEIEMGMIRGYAWSSLTPRERASYADAIGGQFSRGEIDVAALIDNARVLSADPNRFVSTALTGWLAFVIDRAPSTELRDRVRAQGKSIYTPLFRRLRWGPHGGARAENGETRLLREEVIDFLTEVDPALRREAARRGAQYVGFREDSRLHPEAIEPELAEVVVAAAVAEYGAPYFDLAARLALSSNDIAARESLLRGLASTTDSALATRARAWVLEGSVRSTEIFAVLGPQARSAETARATWLWTKENWDSLVPRLPAFVLGRAPRLARGLCTTDDAAGVRAFFADRIDAIEGGPQELRETLEAIELCAALSGALR